MRPIFPLSASFILALWSGSCGNEGLVVHVDGLPPEVVALRVRVLRDGQLVGADREVTRTLQQFVLTDVESGSFTLQVAGLGSERCVVAEGEAPVEYGSGTLRPTYAAVSLSAVPGQRCSLVVVAEAGIDVQSSPPGIDCHVQGAMTSCRADVARGTHIELQARTSDPYGTYPSWTGACSGAAPCTLGMSGPAETHVSAKPRICSADRWCWHNPLPQGNDLNGIWGTGPNNIWAVGGAGTLLHFDGTAWRAVNSGTTQDLYALWGTDANDIWAVGDSGTGVHYDGMQWSVRGLSGDARVIAGSTKNYVWTCGAGSYCLAWNGSSWGQPVSRLFGDNQDISALWLSSDLRGWLFDTKGRAAVLKDRTWGRADSSLDFAVYAIGGNDETDLWAVGEGGAHYDGTKWQKAVLPTGTGTLRAVWVAAINQVWAVGDAGTAIRRDETGWAAVETPTKVALRSIWGSSRDDIWAVGERGVMLHWDGSRWSALGDDRAGGNDLLKAWGSAETDVWAVGGRGSIVHWNGSQLVSSVSDALSDLSAIWGSDASDVWIVGAVGQVLNLQQGHWDTRESATGDDLRSIWLSGSKTGWVGGSSGIFKLNDIHLVKDSDAGSSSVLALWGTSDALWAAQGQTLNKLTLKNQKWSPCMASAPGTMMPAAIWGDDSGVLWVSGWGSDTVIAKNQDCTWTSALNRAGGVQNVYGIWGRGASDVWAVGYYGLTYWYDGSKWTIAGRPSAAELSGLWGTRDGHLWAVGRRGAVLHQGPPAMPPGP